MIKKFKQHVVFSVEHEDIFNLDNPCFVVDDELPIIKQLWSPYNTEVIGSSKVLSIGKDSMIILHKVSKHHSNPLSFNILYTIDGHFVNIKSVMANELERVL